MASVTLVPAQTTVSFKKTSTPAAKRKLPTSLDDLENVENVRHPSTGSSPAKPAAASMSSPPINKKAFTGANVNVAALNNKANIINNQQQPKARISNKVQTPKSASITDPSAATPAADAKSVKAVLPQSVARRNARERNRVKQVNNGFAALRQHIPEEMAEAYEQQKGACATVAATNAASAKKLSKVETLRMAVEYIRNLEGLLNISASNHHVNDHSFSFCDTSSVVSNSPSSPSFSNSSMIDDDPSLHHPTTNLMSFDCDSVPIDQSHVVLPSVTTINGIPYLRLASNQTNLGHGFIDPESGDYVLVSSIDEDHQHMQQSLVYQAAGMDVDQQQPLILYAPATATTPSPLENTFQSNFVNNNLLAPAYPGRTEEFNGDDVCSGRSTAASAVRSPVPSDGDRIKIEQQPSRGPSSEYVNKSPLIRHVVGYGERPRRLQEEEESPPKRHCSINEQFSVVDQSGVIIRGNFIEIKQEHPQFHVDRSSPELLAPAAAESMYDNFQDRLVHMKTEVREEAETDLSLLDSEITEAHMIDAMEWWENERRRSESN